MSVLRGGVEAGGTKVVCAVGGSDGLLAREVVATRAPDETLADVVDFFARQRSVGLEIASLGVASFGPLDLSPGSPTYGRITTTPKPGWAGTDVAGVLGRGVGVPLVLETDVNAAAYGEFRSGATAGLHSSAYLTVGTGVGGGAVVDGRPVRGALHPEMGHLHVVRHPDDAFAGCCPFHGDCVEGLASGPALLGRHGRRGPELGPLTELAVELEAWYLAQLVSAVVYLLSPQRIVLGGGVTGLPGLLPAVRAATLERLGGALDGTGVVDDMAGYLVAPALGDASGVMGALALAELAGPAPVRTGSGAGRRRGVGP